MIEPEPLAYSAITEIKRTFSQRESETEHLGLGRIHLARDNPIVP